MSRLLFHAPDGDTLFDRLKVVAFGFMHDYAALFSLQGPPIRARTSLGLFSFPLH